MEGSNQKFYFRFQIIILMGYYKNVLSIFQLFYQSQTYISKALSKVLEAFYELKKIKAQFMIDWFSVFRGSISIMTYLKIDMLQLNFL